MQIRESPYRLADGFDLGLGGGSPAKLRWETADGNANSLVLELPTPGGVDVPVFIIGTAESTALLDRDLGLFNGVTETTLGIQDSDGDTHLVMDYSADDAARIRTIGTTRNLTLDPTGDLVVFNVSRTGDGIVYIGDPNLSNAKMTKGVTIHQGAADNEILAFKSSDTTHGVTGFAQTDTFGFFMKESGGDSGLRMRGISEATVGVKVSGVSTTDDAAKTTSATGVIVLDTRKKAGTGSDVVGTNGNCVTIHNGTGTKFVFDTEGDFHYDGSLTEFADVYNDVHLIRSLDYVREKKGAKGLIRSRWDDFVKYSESTLIELGILGDTLANGGLINMTGVQRLHNGAIWQGYQRHCEMQERIDVLETKLLALEGAK